MKIFQILYPGLGGHSSVAFSLIEGDVKKIYHHKLIGYGIEAPSESFIFKAKETNTEYYSILKKNGIDITSLKEIYKILKTEKPDVILMHSTAVVFSVFIYSLFNKVKWISIEHQSNFAKSKKDWFYTFFILLLSPQIVYLSEDYKKQIKSRFKLFFPSRKISIVNNGININPYKISHEKQLKPNLVHLAMISRFNLLRDHETLIKAVFELKKHQNIKLSIAGDGNTKPEMEKMVKDLNLESEVAFLGVIEEAEITKLLQKVDIYIHSSLAETQSTSILQVMASKTPIIATDIPGINNVLENEKNVLLFEKKNVNQLINCIEKLTNETELKSLIAQNAYIDVKLKFSLENMYNLYSKLWK